MGNQPSSHNDNTNTNTGGIATTAVTGVRFSGRRTTTNGNSSTAGSSSSRTSVSPPPPFASSTVTTSTSSHALPPLPPPAAISAGVISIRNVFQQLHLKNHMIGNNNALGLSKVELDERCKPSGLYSTCHWDEKTLRRLIGDGKLASRQQWNANPNNNKIELDPEQHECPICFFTYPQMNITKCCQANLCTECYLQLQPYQKPSSSSDNNNNSNTPSSKPVINAKTQQNACPFCNTTKLLVTVGPMQRVPTEQPPPPPEQSVRFVTTDQQSSETEHLNTMTGSINTTTPQQELPPTPSGFGSTLEQNSRVAMMRARSCSIASTSDQSHSSSTSVKEQQELVCQAAMTVQERHQIEDEMRAQQLHPLALKIEQEEMERRMKNQLQYHSQRNLRRSTSAASSEQNFSRRNLLHSSLSSQLNNSTAQLPPLPSQNQRHLGSSSLSPMISNILFLHNPTTTTNRGPSSLSVRGLSEDEQLALAIEASLRDSTTTTTN